MRKKHFISSRIIIFSFCSSTADIIKSTVKNKTGVDLDALSKQKVQQLQRPRTSTFYKTLLPPAIL
jgi:hypothetical protein